MTTNKRKPPRYILAIVVLMMMPLLAYPWVLSTTQSEYRTLVAMYPVYVLASGFCINGISRMWEIRTGVYCLYSLYVKE